MLKTYEDKAFFAAIATLILISFICIYTFVDKDICHAVVEVNSKAGTSEIHYSTNTNSNFLSDERVLSSFDTLEEVYHYTFKDKNDSLTVKMTCAECDYNEEITFAAGTVAKLFACDCKNSLSLGISDTQREFFALTATWEGDAQ